jgi:hypothetical protein
MALTMNKRRVHKPIPMSEHPSKHFVFLLGERQPRINRGKEGDALMDWCPHVLSRHLGKIPLQKGVGNLEHRVSVEEVAV